MTSLGVSGRRLELGRVATLTFDLAGRDFLVNFAIAALLALVPTLLTGALTQGVLAGAAAGAGPRPATFGPAFLLLAIVNLLISILVYATIVSGLLERVQGRTPTLAERFAPAVRALPTLIGVGVLGYIGLVIGLVLLIVPGVILATMWILVFPVAVAETRNVFTCFGRSAALTKGHRWKVLAILAVAWVGAVVVSLLSALVINAVLGVGGNPFLTVGTGPLALVARLVRMLVAAAVEVVWGAGLVALYSELRTLAGGLDARRLDQVFG